MREQMDMDVYEFCPQMETERFLLRLVEEKDAEDLLQVYSDKAAVALMNSDNCTNDFYFTSPEQMDEMIRFWTAEYEMRYYVRWSIVDKESGHVVGTVELFHREAEDFFDDCGILRLDLRSDYEQSGWIAEIVGLVLEPGWKLFGYGKVAVKAIPEATERIEALRGLGFVPTEEKLIGKNGREYGSYFVLEKE